MAVSSDQVIRRADVLWRTTIGGVLVRPLAAHEIVKLAGTGAALWGALDAPSTFGDLCAALAASHDTTLAAVADDLVLLIDDLITRGVIA